MFLCTFVDGSMGMGTCMQDCRDGSMGIGEWGWKVGDGYGTEAWDNFFQVVFCQQNCIFLIK